MKVIILAGGRGVRLWPVSRRAFPKQFLTFGGQKSLLQQTIARFLPHISPKDIVIITNQEYYYLVKSQAESLHPTLQHQVLVEPEQKNTAPAICLGIKYLQEKHNLAPHDTVLISSSDHFIQPEDLFISTVKQGKVLAQQGLHVLFGIPPNKPETGYGYIKGTPSSKHAGLQVEQFIEKPTLAIAQTLVLSGEYLWNSGIFLFQVQSFWEDIEKYCPDIFAQSQGSLSQMLSHFPDMPNISIDHALMEKTTRTVVLPLPVSWSDVGSWDSVYDALDKDINQNVKIGNVLDIETKNCLIFGERRLISTIGLEDLLIVDTGDAIFIGKKGLSQQIRTIVEHLQKHKAKESIEHLTSHRPWGSFTILEEGERYKIKRIVVLPHQILSLQMHYHRSEHWIVIKGTAKVTLGDKKTLVHENESVYVNKSEVHRLENPGKVPLELIEVQVGEYVGEDDIVRLQDVYERTVAPCSGL